VVQTPCPPPSHAWPVVFRWDSLSGRFRSVFMCFYRCPLSVACALFQLPFEDLLWAHFPPMAVVTLLSKRYLANSKNVLLEVTFLTFTRFPFSPVSLWSAQAPEGLGFRKVVPDRVLSWGGLSGLLCTVYAFGKTVQAQCHFFFFFFPFPVSQRS